MLYVMICRAFPFEINADLGMSKRDAMLTLMEVRAYYSAKDIVLCSFCLFTYYVVQ